MKFPKVLSSSFALLLQSIAVPRSCLLVGGLLKGWKQAHKKHCGTSVSQIRDNKMKGCTYTSDLYQYTNLLAKHRLSSTPRKLMALDTNGFDAVTLKAVHTGRFPCIALQSIEVILRSPAVFCGTDGGHLKALETHITRRVWGGGGGGEFLLLHLIVMLCYKTLVHTLVSQSTL